MATRYAFVEYDSTGAANYAVPFTYLSTDYVKVFVGGLITADYIWESPSNIRFNVAPPIGFKIIIVRDTKIDNRLIAFNKKTKLTGGDLDIDSKQAFDLIQELKDEDQEISDRIDAIDLVLDANGSSVFDADFTVLGVTQGSYDDGDLIPEGTDLLDVIKGMLTNIIPPTYVAPTLSLSGTGAASVESGTSINPTLTPNFTQNDGGSINDYNLLRNSVVIFNDVTPSAQSGGPITIGDGTITYRAETSYDDGPIKNDNAGNPYPTGQILASTVTSNNVVYTGKRKAFYQIDGDIVDIRSNTNSFLGPVNGTSFSVFGSGNRLVVSYPDTLRDLTNVTLTSSGFSFNITSEMVVRPSQLVNDAVGANPITYKVFEYVAAAPFTDGTFDITI